MLVHDLRFFRLKEFQHPELINPVAAELLDEVRNQFGQALFVTDDARLPSQHPVGSVADSLHYKGQAFDLRIHDFNGMVLYKLVSSMISVAEWVCRGQKSGVEIELVWSKSDKHAHIGFWLGARSFNTLIVRAE